MSYIKEACVETFEEALLAEKKAADQIELCSRLDLDGLTPDKSLVEKLHNCLSIPIKVMIRPREGDFFYSEDELNQMKSDIDFFKKLGVKAVVFGVVDRKKQLNLNVIHELAILASPMEVTIHKAIDSCEDPVFEIDRLKKIPEISSVLSSGKAPTALEGKELLRKMVKTAGNQLTIIAAGKITNENVEEIHQLINTKAYHGKQIVGNLSH